MSVDILIEISDGITALEDKINDNLCLIADTKNSIGLAGSIEEISHNAIAVYWNPLESAAKVCALCPCPLSLISLNYNH